MQAQSWEVSLMTLATEPLRSGTKRFDAAYEDSNVTERELLDEAYAYTTGITRSHSRTFSLASALLPRAKRNAVRALYAFCRQVDDIVDNSAGSVHEESASYRVTEDRLSSFRGRMLYQPVSGDDLVAIAWRDAQQQYSIPVEYAEQLIDGVHRDLVQTRYDSFDELCGYAYSVASTVGLMSMHIIGYKNDDAIPYAVKLGVALQITNILRDVGEDWRMGRLYLPKQELEQFGLTEEDVAQGAVDDRWRTFMRYQIERNRRLYHEAWPGIRMLSRDGRFAIAAAARLYQDILTEIEKNDYDVFHRRASVSAPSKLMHLPLIWLSSLL